MAIQENITLAKDIFYNNSLMMGTENPFINYDDIVQQVCQNVDERIKFLAILLPIVWMAGNWFYNKCHDGKFIQKHFSSKSFTMIWPNIPYGFKGKKEGEDWFCVENMSGRDIVLEFVVPIFRMLLLFGMGFLIYYTQTAGMG